MTETDLQLGGGYTYQWECAILLALNYFFEPVRYNPILFDLVNDFLGQVAEIHLEGEDRESGVDLEDITLVNGDRRILIQVKTKQAEGERWTPTDPLLLKALYRFYDSRFLTERPEDTRFVFLTNRPFNRTLVRVKSAIKKGTVDQCAEADKLCQHLERYVRKEKGESIDVDRFREMLARMALVDYLAVDEVKANVQAKLQAHGRRDWEQAHALLFEHCARQSTRIGGGTVTRASVIEVLGPPPEVRGENLRAKELAYLDGLLARYEYWRDHYTPLAGIAEVHAAVQDGPRLDMPMPFIPPEFEKLVEHGYGERVEVRRVPVDDLREAVAEHRRIILLGEPGSGKTTTLWRLAYDYANAAQADRRAPLPVLVPLGGYTDPGLFDAYLARYLGPLAPYLETYRASGRLILLLDGLNEMPRAGYAERVERIQDVLDRQPDEAVVVTCRALDYVVKLEGLKKVEVSPLDEERIQTFLHNYLGDTAGERLFWAMAGGDEVRDLWDTWQRAGGTWKEFWTAENIPYNVDTELTQAQYWLWRHLREEPPPLLLLGRNPYLLLMTVQVHAGAGGRLPANRAQLFAAFVDALQERERRKWSGVEWIEAEHQQVGLAALAHAMQVERGQGTTVEREWAVARLYQAVPDCDAERLLYLASSATLLDADEVTVRFYHQLLQEYFAALELGRRVVGGEALDHYWPPERWWEPSGWEETAILLAGMEPDASVLLDKLAVVNPVVAARCLVESGTQVSETVRRGITETLIARMTDGKQPPIARAQAGDALARLGDSRPGVSLREDGLPDIVWCHVPAGPFIMGSPDDSLAFIDKETPQCEVKLPAFRIGKYPVTNAQYAVFVQDDGYTEKWRHCWTDAGWGWKGDRTELRAYDGVFDLPNHPVVDVSWYEAVAFCRWLTERLHEAGDLGPDQEVMLPTEAQWEKAARGGVQIPNPKSQDPGEMIENPIPDRVYPWGDQFDAAKCNMVNTGIGTTSAVGIFPAGASPYGVEDLSGNVWEWCRTKWRDSYGELADESLEGDALRVVRGGGFSLYGREEKVRCAARLFGINPNLRSTDLSFRVYVVSRQD